ncbi:YcaO-like family protein [Streptomyces sp. NBC_01716]|uniref:YcaO-like family protein n=1 Tax=Streptomyces sp. NBC_01716 TaxID=2975917 RepID=UPI002E335A57|nr:YcaO-like family protein [Streptomyces sp. NBC_01716]
MRTALFDGTHRTLPPARTWQAIKPLLPAYGITRVADVTGLDDLGIPVTMVVRPLSRTLSVAQGKGMSLDAARVSGAMEALEVWHAEQAVPPADIRRVPAADLGLPYSVGELEQHAGALATDRTRLDWITARSTVDGAVVPVPAAAVRLGRQEHDDWRLHLPSASTNGLASGNTRAEALAHGLAEVIERDVLSTVPRAGGRVELIDPATVDGEPAVLVDRLRRARVWVELTCRPNRFGVPVMCCHLWREDQAAVLVAGSGAHPDPAVALTRAITEAAQSRLTLITGSREDTHPAVHRAGASVRLPPARHLTRTPGGVAGHSSPLHHDAHHRHRHGRAPGRVRHGRHRHPAPRRRSDLGPIHA